MNLIFLALLFSSLLIGSYSNSFSRVLELTDRFLEVRQDGQWLVMFYAPWCGHCHKLEPIFMQAAQSLTDTPVRVGKLDCTRFTSVANELGIKGFPTVLFVKGDEVFTFTRDRTRDELVNFAKRLSGPAVKILDTCGDFQQVFRDEKLFFVYAGERNGDLWASYASSAAHLQDHLMFVATKEDCVRWQAKISQFPAIGVFKEDGNSVMPKFVLEGDVTLNDTVRQWIVQEQFEEFVRVSYGNFPLLLKTNKFLVLAVLEEDKVGRLSREMENYKNDLHSVMRNNREAFDGKVQFGWISTPDIANSIAIEALELPSLIALNSTTYEHFVPDHDLPSQMNQEEMYQFVLSILNETAAPKGGKSYSVSFQRSLFEARTSLVQMWRGNPVLTSVLFGLPLGFLSLICYSICCGDILEASDEDEPLLDEDHEKKE